MDIDSVLNQMRREHAPTPEDRDRVRAALATALVVGGTAGAAHVATTAGLEGAAAIKGTALALPVWIKGAIGVGTLVAAVGGGVYGVNSYRATAAKQAPAAALTPAQPALASPGADARRLLEPSAPLASRGIVSPASGAVENEAAAATRPSHALKPRSLGTKPAAAQELSTTSLAELRLIGEASRAIREGRTQEARSALSEHEKLYSNTALTQERAGLELLSRCAEGGGDETRRAAEALLKSSPKSPLAGTIRRECLK